MEILARFFAKNGKVILVSHKDDMGEFYVVNFHPNGLAPFSRVFFEEEAAWDSYYRTIPGGQEWVKSIHERAL